MANKSRLSDKSGNRDGSVQRHRRETSPSTFHLKNRGIIYRCAKFEFDNKSKLLRVTVPNIAPDEFDDLENGEPKFGIADGGHTSRSSSRRWRGSTNCGSATAGQSRSCGFIF